MAVFPPGMQLQLQSNVSQERFLFLTNLQIEIRRQYNQSCKFIQSQSLAFCNPTYSFRNPKLHHLQGSLTKCYCLGTLVNAKNAAATYDDWVPHVGQVLLMASIFLTYIAGVIPFGKPLADSWKNNPSIAGSATKSKDEDNHQFAWDIVRRKLLDSLYAMKQAANAGNGLSGVDKDAALQRSSLFALAELPRIRCLLASFQWLRKEADNISGRPKVDFSIVFKRTIQKSYKDSCLAWLEEELSLKHDNPNKALLFEMIDKLNGYDSALDYIRKSGKEDLYAELIAALRFGSSGRYWFSLFLELSDIMTPLLRTVIGKISDAISFFLVCLIGRSLGLIYTGIRQSLRWK